MTFKPERQLKVGDWWYLPDQDKLVKFDAQGGITLTANLDNLCQRALNYFLLNAGRLVTRDELLSDVWGVRDVSDGRISRVIRVLRLELGDDSREPKYIETIPKRGFRFIAEVDEVPQPPLKSSDPQPELQELVDVVAPPSETEESATAAETELETTAPTPAPARGWLRYAIAMSVMVLFACWWLWPTSVENDSKYHRFEPLSSLPGSERFVDATPDGRYLVYFYRPSNSSEEQLVLQDRKSSSKTVLVRTSSELLSGPQFSPDGLSIIYQRQVMGSNCSIRMLELSEEHNVKSDRELIKCHPQNFRSQMSWSPNGKYLIYPDYREDTNNIALMLLPLSGGSPERLTIAPSTSRGDIIVSFAADSDHFAFVRDVAESMGQIWVMSLSDREAKMLYHPQDRYPAGLAWRESDTKLVYPASQHQIKEIDVQSGQVSRTMITDAPSRDFVGLADGSLLASTGDNWQIRLLKSANPLMVEGPVADVQQSESLVELNPVADKPDAVVSRRSGLQVVSLRYADGSQQKIGEFASDFFINEFDYSPDGEELLVGHASNLWILSKQHAPIQVNPVGTKTRMASWGHEPGVIYYFVSTQGHWILKKYQKSTQRSETFSEDYSFYLESEDGHYKVWRIKDDEALLFQVKGKEVQKVQVPGSSIGSSAGFLARSKSLYFPYMHNTDQHTLYRLEIDTGKLQNTGIPLWGAGRLYTVSRDELWIYRDAGRFGDLDVSQIRF